MTGRNKSSLAGLAARCNEAAAVVRDLCSDFDEYFDSDAATDEERLVRFLVASMLSSARASFNETKAVLAGLEGDARQESNSQTSDPPTA